MKITAIKDHRPIARCTKHNYMWLGDIRTCVKCWVRLSARNSQRTAKVDRTDVLAQKTSNDVQNKNNTLRTQI